MGGGWGRPSGVWGVEGKRSGKVAAFYGELGCFVC